MASTTLYPLPHTCGNTTETEPTINPPIANFTYSGAGNEANRALLQASSARNGGAKCPRSTPNTAYKMSSQFSPKCTGGTWNTGP